MTIQELFEYHETTVGDEKNQFTIDLAEAVTKNQDFRGHPIEEIKKYLTTGKTILCACGNESFNCICQIDAE